MTFTALPGAAVLAAIIAAGATAGALAHTTASGPHHPGMQFSQATPPAEGAPPGQPGMMGQGMMGREMMGGMMQPGMMGAAPMMPMRGPMMKIMFAIADANGDGGLSFEEIAAIHKRIFDKVDADKDGKVTPEEVQTFMRE